MAYSDIIDATNPDHRWSFDGDSTDQIGTADGTDSGVTYTGSALCEDVTNSMYTNTADDDRVTIPSTTDINNSAQSRKAVAGWFMTNSVQTPPKRIYGEGIESLVFHFPMALGNNVMFEVVDSGQTLVNQIYGIILQPNRAYHLCGIFEGSDYANKVRFYIDGVEQLSANPSDRETNVTTLSARGAAEFGDPVGTVGIGNSVVKLNACVNGYYNQWATWNGANAVLSASTIRDDLFEKGALPNVTISTDTESNMQSSLNSYSNTKRGNYPLCIRVEPVSGGGDFTLTASGITFDELSSIHVQYTGTDTLTWRNDINSNASIFSTTSGGTIEVFNQVNLTITNLKNPTEVRVYKAGTTTEVAGDENVTGGTFTTKIYDDSVDIALVSIDYKIKRLTSVDTSSDTYLSITQFVDNVYSNP